MLPARRGSPAFGRHALRSVTQSSRDGWRAPRWQVYQPGLARVPPKQQLSPLPCHGPVRRGRTPASGVSSVIRPSAFHRLCGDSASRRRTSAYPCDRGETTLLLTPFALCPTSSSTRQQFIPGKHAEPSVHEGSEPRGSRPQQPAAKFPRPAKRAASAGATRLNWSLLSCAASLRCAEGSSERT